MAYADCASENADHSADLGHKIGALAADAAGDIVPYAVRADCKTHLARSNGWGQRTLQLAKRRATTKPASTIGVTPESATSTPLSGAVTAVALTQG